MQQFDKIRSHKLSYRFVNLPRNSPLLLIPKRTELKFKALHKQCRIEHDWLASRMLTTNLDARLRAGTSFFVRGGDLLMVCHDYRDRVCDGTDL